MIRALLAGRVCGFTGTGELHRGAAGAGLADPTPPAPVDPEVAPAAVLVAAGTAVTVWWSCITTRVPVTPVTPRIATAATAARSRVRLGRR